MSLVIDDRKSNRTDNDRNTTRIDWTTPLASIIPEDFVLPDDYATTHVTIEDALSHRTGMPDHIRHFGGNGPSSRTVREEVRLLRHLPSTAELRTKYMYNNLMYTAVSHTIETLTGEDLGAFLSHRIWTPLQMTDTYWTPEEAQASDKVLAQGYAWNTDKGEYIPEPPPDIIGSSGAGAIISNVLDYAKWIRCMMTREGPLSAEAHEALVQPRTIITDDPTILFPPPHLYALGWTQAIYRGEHIVWHPGGVAGYGATVMFLPAQQWGLVMAGNTTLTSNFVQVVLYMYLLDELLKTPPNERLDWSRLIWERVNLHREQQMHARELLYPQLPTVPLPPAHLVHEYAGLYIHPAYGRLDLFVDAGGSGLVADRTTCEVPMMVVLEHVSGEFWLATLQEKNQDPRDYEKVRAEFKTGVDSRVNEVGVDLEAEMAGEKIWFRRVY
ncbi:beta-lactamase/transpeptidase-like protein [Aspergillus alliaceus]|nr:beta-lactamase/transpeptidase-like protein [Aspergillus alliaceus]KAB8229860.1 beta-lactamase/transpeptidase-like protein [Aspergillus alliaceus]